MNPERLRAGKAVEQTGQSPLLPGSSDKAKWPAGTHKPQTAPSVQWPLPSKVPQILFEGDEPSEPSAAGFARKFELGARPQVELSNPEEMKLPEAYGTGKLLLTSRDPHTLYAHWDLTSEQQRRYNSLSGDGHLALRAYAHAFSNQPAIEVRLQPESRHVFVPVKRAGTRYVGELGYYQPDHHWKTIATSGPAAVPFDAPSEDTAVTFAQVPQPQRTIKPEVASTSTAKTTTAPDALPSIIPVPVPRWPFGPAHGEDEQLAKTESPLQQMHPLPADAPFVKRVQGKEWTPAQERLLAEMIRMSSEQREWLSSAEIAKLVRDQIQAPEMEWPFLPGALVNVSSPARGAEHERKGFWFSVNAELIIYGATEPNVQVTVGGRPIKLRPDGTFSCRFALPDGTYDITAVALSAENETREATMNFCRRTDYSADVGAHPQNPFLERIPQPQ